MTAILKTLKTGLRVINEYDANKAGASVLIHIKAGSMYETDANSGISHLIEHMLFKGTTARTSQQITEEFENIGASINAYTKSESTCFYATALEENIEKCCEIFADMIYNSSFDENELAKEKKVVYEEMAMYNDDPGSVAFDEFQRLFYKGTYLERPIIGNKKSVSAITSEDCKSYTSKYYVEPNIIISFAGGVTDEKAMKLAKKYFNKSKVNQSPNIAVSTDRTLLSPKMAFSAKKKDVNQAWVVIGFPAHNNLSGLKSTYSLIDFVLGEGMSSKLFQKVREELGLVYSIHAYTEQSAIGGAMMILFGTNNDSAGKAIQTVKNVLDDIVANGISQTEYERARTYKKTSVVFSSETTINIARKNADYVAIYNRTYDVQSRIEDLEKVSIKQINNTIADIFNTKNICGAIVSNAPKLKVFEPLK